MPLKIKSAHLFKLCIMLIAFLTQAQKGPDNNNSLLSTDRQVITSNMTEPFEMLSLSQCVPWMTVGLANCVAIVTLNLYAIIVFVRNSNLRKRSMYLVINLAVTDMLVGGIAVYPLFYVPGAHCNLWKWKIGANNFISIFLTFFFIASFTNIAIIALERAHATFFPFRHRVLKKWVYRLIIAVVWVTSGLVTLVDELPIQFNTFYFALYWVTAFVLISLLIICVSYTSIVIKVRCRAQPQRHGAASRERNLTMTLLIVTVVSLLLCLPQVILTYITNFKILSLPFSVDAVFLNLFYANTLANPILYAIRLPEYRSALLAFFCKGPQQQRQVEVFPLRDM